MAEQGTHKPLVGGSNPPSATIPLDQLAAAVDAGAHALAIPDDATLVLAVSGGSDSMALLGGARIFDQAPANVAFPYITFGRTSIYDWSTGTESGTEQLFTLHVWSKMKGKKETLDIMDLVTRPIQAVMWPVAHAWNGIQKVGQKLGIG